MLRDRPRAASGKRVAGTAGAAIVLAWASIAFGAGRQDSSPSPVAPAPVERAAGGAVDLALAPNLSFVDDSSAAFPIVGSGLDAAEIATDRPTAIFFGAAHCWNTNREAERFVAVYQEHRAEVRFLVVDVERPSPGQGALMRRFYEGAIPTLAVLDRDGRPVYVQAGETAAQRGDDAPLDAIVTRALAAR